MPAKGGRGLEAACHSAAGAANGVSSSAGQPNVSGRATPDRPCRFWHWLGPALLESATYEDIVLVTALPYEVASIAQLYRDRADAENPFDELKNQWGWAGFTTRDFERCQITARLIALIDNWWSLFVRLVDGERHREAVTSRPTLLGGVARDRPVTPARFSPERELESRPQRREQRKTNASQPVSARDHRDCGAVEPA
jgi:hypothetical protein